MFFIELNDSRHSIVDLTKAMEININSVTPTCHYMHIKFEREKTRLYEYNDVEVLYSDRERIKTKLGLA